LVSADVLALMFFFLSSGAVCLCTPTRAAQRSYLLIFVGILDAVYLQLMSVL
jgi:hypothetical protein